MKILIITNTYPSDKNPYYGIFIKEQVDSIKKQGIDLDVLSISPEKSKLNYLKSIFDLIRLSFSKRYDIIHSYHCFSGIVSRFQIKYPIVINFLGSEVLNKKTRLLSKILSRIVTKTIVRSEEMKDVLGCKNAYVIPSGVNLTMFKPIPKSKSKKALNLSKNKKYVLFVGNPKRAIKGFNLAKKSFEILNGKNKNSELIVVNNVKHTKIPQYMNACDVLIFTSEQEGSPNVVKEAMACNLPIVSVDVGDVKKVIKGVGGCFICSRYPEDIAEKLDLAVKFGRTGGRGRVKELGLSIEQSTKKIISVYKEIVEERKK